VRSLQEQALGRFPDHDIQIIAADLTEPLGLPPLDGVKMASSLHSLDEKEPMHGSQGPIHFWPQGPADSNRIQRRSRQSLGAPSHLICALAGLIPPFPLIFGPANPFP
jgi:hypothetical protein